MHFRTGKATKVFPFLTDGDKCYEAEVILGAYTTTEDATGEVLETFPVTVTKEDILKVVESFVGDYTQIPPMYSAIKVNGVRLYELARKGIVVDRPARDMKIYQCDLIEWLDTTRFRIRVACSKGTYIRTLCTDIGKMLGCGAHMGELKRIRVGRYMIEDSITLQELEKVRDDLTQHLWPIESVFEAYPAYTIKEDYQKALANGNPLPYEAVTTPLDSTQEYVCIYNEKNIFIGVYQIDREKHRLKVEKLFI